MTDLTNTIIPKSDQFNADDLIGGRMITIRVTKVSLCAEPEQPIAIGFEGDNGKPYKPGKSMRRVLVNTWGPDGSKYVGRSMRLYRDDNVVFGGVKVGGIRISHMSDISEPVTMALTASKTNRKPFTVKPLPKEATQPRQEPARTKPAPEPQTLPQEALEPEEYAAGLDSQIDAAKDSNALKGWMLEVLGSDQWTAFEERDPDEAKRLYNKAQDRVRALKKEGA